MLFSLTNHFISLDSNAQSSLYPPDSDPSPCPWHPQLTLSTHLSRQKRPRNLPSVNPATPPNCFFGSRTQTPSRSGLPLFLRALLSWLREGNRCWARAEWGRGRWYVPVRRKWWINRQVKRSLKFQLLWRWIWVTGATQFTSDPVFLINPSFFRGLYFLGLIAS